MAFAMFLALVCVVALNITLIVAMTRPRRDDDEPDQNRGPR